MEDYLFFVSCVFILVEFLVREETWVIKFIFVREELECGSAFFFFFIIIIR